MIDPENCGEEMERLRQELRTRKETPVERDLSVIWQRHLPEGYAQGDALDVEEEYHAIVADLEIEVGIVLSQLREELAKGDLVLTISRRLPLASSS